MKRLIGVLLAIAMLVTLIPVAAFATETEERLVYQSSTNFSTETGDGTWDDGIWSATLIDLSATNPYSTVTTPNGEGTNYLSAHGTYVDADEIAPVTQNANKDNFATYGGAKTFTAPRNGKITISYADVANGENVGAVVKYAWNQGMKFRVTKQSGESGATTIYPADAEYVENKTNNGTIIVVESGVTTETTVNKGDKIHFEIMRMDNKQPWQGVYCDPIITYGAEEEGGEVAAPAERDKFRSAEYYDTTGETAKWDSGVWQAWFYDWDDATATTEREKYKIMVGTRTDDNIVKWTNNEKSESGAYNWNSNAAQVGPEFMRVEFIPNDKATTYEKTYSEEVLSYPIGRDYPVKIFVAPKSGYVSIDAETMTLPFETHGTNVRIMKMGAASGEPVQVWPASGFKTYAAGTAISFETVGTQLEAGDMLLFECAFIFGEGFASPYGGAINWDPTVEYTEAPAVDPDDPDTPVTPTEKTKYISSENFSTASGDGTWGDVWSANSIDTSTDTYTAMTANNDIWTGAKGTWIDADEIVPVTQTNNANSYYETIGAAKTFTAPKDGFVQISYAELTHGEIKGGVLKYAWNQGMKFRVRHQSDTEITTVYPKTGDYLEKAANASDLYMIDANTVTNTIEVKQGDKLHFEVMRLVPEQPWQGVFCDPIVEYIDEADVPDDPLASDPADKKVYKSSENFTDTQNGDYAWKWQYYDINTKEYKNLTSVSQMQGFGVNAEEKATIWYLPQNTQYNKDRGISVGAVGMRVAIDEPDDVATDGEKAGEIERNYPVKSFTAPKRGSVTISADIFEPGHTTGGAALRIIKHSLDGTQTKLYPADAEWINIYSGDTFTAITTELEKGDILTFENALWKNNSAWQAIIRWDPVITYTKLIPVMDDCNTEIGATDVPLNKEHILTYSGDIAAPSASEIKIYEVASDGTKTESNAKSKSITADGKDLKIVFDGLKPYTEYEVEVGGVAFAATPDDTAANTLKFTTGPVVMIGEAEYADGKVTVDVNNSQEAPAKATLAAFLCKGTETEYTVENVRIITRTDIGANDSLEAAITLPSGDYFIKAMVLEDALTARAYAPMTILRGEN